MADGVITQEQSPRAGPDLTPTAMPPSTPQVDWQNDPDFHQLPLIEKHKVLTKIDPDYAGLPSTEQAKALSVIHYGAPPEEDKEGFFSHAADVVGKQISGLGSTITSSVTGPIDAYQKSRAAGHGVLNSFLAGAGTAAEKSLDPLGVEEGVTKGTLDTATGGYAKRRAEGYNPVYAAAAPTLAPAVGVNLSAMEDAASKGQTKAVAAEAAVPAAEVLAGEASRIPAVQKLARPFTRAVEGARDTLSEAVTRPTLSRSFSKKMADDVYGHSPERAVVKENVRTSAQAEAKMKDVGQKLSDQLNTHAGKNVDVESIVKNRAHQFRDEALKEQTDNPAAKAIDNIADAMLKKQGASPNMSPRAAAEMKSYLYSKSKFNALDGPDIATGKEFQKQVAADIRDEINKVTNDPKIKELNQRYGDLASARDTMYRQEIARTDKGMATNAKNVLAERGTRKVAQFIGTQYEPQPPPYVPGPGATKPRRPGLPPSGGTPPGPGITRQNPPTGGGTPPSAPQFKPSPLKLAEGRTIVTEPPKRLAATEKPAARPLSHSSEERVNKITGGKDATPSDMIRTWQEDNRQLEVKIRSAKPGLERHMAEGRIRQNNEMIAEARKKL